MKQIIQILILLSWSLSAHGQLTLEDCQQKAHDNYPLIKQYDLITAAENYTLDNISKIYLPQVALNGQATYQSDVTRLVMKGNPPINLADFMQIMPKDQYKAYVEAQQLLWDGGQSRAQSDVVKANGEMEKQKIEVDMYSIKSKINQLYFGILSVNEQQKQLALYYADLQSVRDLAASALRNGVAMQADTDLVRVELLNLDQKKIELQTAKDAYLKMLSIFIFEKLSDSTQLQTPADITQFSDSVTRPELNLFGKQRSVYEAQENTIYAQNKPKLGLFVQGGFGRPGLNMLEPNFKPYAIGGVKFTWNFGTLYTKKNDLSLIENNLNLLKVQEETFLFNTRLQMSEAKPEIEKYKKLMDNDAEIVSLRERVEQTSESKYKNGVYLMKDLISDINEENLSRQAKALHYIQYLLSIYNYKYTQGGD
jgi:outer membrane protein TolC